MSGVTWVVWLVTHRPQFLREAAAVVALLIRASVGLPLSVPVQPVPGGVLPRGGAQGGADGGRAQGVPLTGPLGIGANRGKCW